ncbi:faciogenital dysplasia protein [Anaeramoeba flamelloides]|uniref:Faciogenital dysplasia protein n=1 Tax=Anaeramoeba flamelloides TaxID=1746091 RepID=A0AAV7Y4Q8_9EUKA|nr:faciogenital dysplasia protein [Anaeramoeba flamelloides]
MDLESTEIVQSLLRRHLAKVSHHKLVIKSLNRSDSISELLSTERTYVHRLFVLLNVFKKRLQEESKLKKPIVTKKDIDCIFFNVDTIFNKHNNKLLKEMENRFKKTSHVHSQLVGDMFTRLDTFLVLYAKYCHNYETSFNKVASLRKNKKKFEQLLFELKEHELTQEMDITSYLILPVQRIPRYNLLISTIIKYTSKKHPDYKNLTSALDKMKKLANDINLKIKHYERLTKLTEIKSLFDSSCPTPKEKSEILEIISEAIDKAEFSTLKKKAKAKVNLQKKFLSNISSSLIIYKTFRSLKPPVNGSLMRKNVFGSKNIFLYENKELMRKGSSYTLFRTGISSEDFDPNQMEMLNEKQKILQEKTRRRIVLNQQNKSISKSPKLQKLQSKDGRVYSKTPKLKRKKNMLNVKSLKRVPTSVVQELRKGRRKPSKLPPKNQFRKIIHTDQNIKASYSKTTNIKPKLSKDLIVKNQNEKNDLKSNIKMEEEQKTYIKNKGKEKNILKNEKVFEKKTENVKKTPKIAKINENENENENTNKNEKNVLPSKKDEKIENQTNIKKPGVFKIVDKGAIASINKVNINKSNYKNIENLQRKWPIKISDMKHNHLTTGYTSEFNREEYWTELGFKMITPKKK